MQTSKEDDIATRNNTRMSKTIARKQKSDKSISAGILSDKLAKSQTRTLGERL